MGVEGAGRGRGGGGAGGETTEQIHLKQKEA